MFASLSKEEQRRQRYIRDVRRLVIEMFKLSDKQAHEQNRLWAEWLDVVQERKIQRLNLLPVDAKHLSKFILGDAGDAFKARAIAILLAPEDRLIPFTWPVRVPDYSWRYAEIDFARLSPQLQMFSLSVLEINSGLNIADAERPDARVVHSFNEFILSKLAVLLEDDATAERLFNCYQLYVERGNQYDYYRSFELILRAKIPEKWKKLADDKMRELIRLRQKGRTRRRNAFDSPFLYYMDPIMVHFLSELPYSMDLFASQIAFIIGSPGMDDDKLSFLSSHTGTVQQMLEGEPYAELRGKLIKFCEVIAEKEARDKVQARKANAAFQRHQEQEEKRKTPERNILARMR
ncbi:MAG: hypothetical protein NUV90_02635 [Candidatus Parcubacteria bacterium]|nr:hypothetical protein [Candidatus Parcubacteria bacterium]